MANGERVPLRAAIVGLDSAFWPHGFWGTANEHPDCELIGACDLGLSDEVLIHDFIVDPSEYLAERNLRRFSSVDEVLAEGIDVAFLCSRNTVMPQVAGRLIEAGVHVFAAKPMALEPEDARRYLAGRDRGVVVTAGQAASAWQPYPTLLRLVREGRIGELLTMHAMHQHWNYDDFPASLWYADPTEGDLCNWLGWYPVEAVVAAMGPVARITAVSRQTVSHHDDLPDQTAAILELESGRFATAVVHFTVGQWPVPMHEAAMVGANGVLRYQGPGDTVQVLDADGEHRIPFDGGPEQLAFEVDRFLSAVRGGGEPFLPVETAVHVAEVCAAWRESARTGRPVDVARAPERVAVAS